MTAHGVRRLALLVLALLVTGLFATVSCAEGDDMHENQDTQPVPTLPGGNKFVLLTAEQERQFGVRSQSIDWASPTPHVTNHEVIPTAGVIIDPSGASWIYIRIRPLTYLRTPVVIDHVDQGVAYVDDAPAKGVTVVIAGAAGIYSVETASVSP
jgi:hypothetical protein